MNAYSSLRRIALTLALALLGLAVPMSAAQVGDFHASGTVTVIDSQGAFYELSGSGHAKPGGNFTTTVLGKAIAHGFRQYAVQTFDFGRGDTLTVEIVAAYADASSPFLVGTYTVTGGTGRLAGASGSGDFIAEPGAEVSWFEFDGTLLNRRPDTPWPRSRWRVAAHFRPRIAISLRGRYAFLYLRPTLMGSSPLMDCLPRRGRTSGNNRSSTGRGKGGQRGRRGKGATPDCFWKQSGVAPFHALFMPLRTVPRCAAGFGRSFGLVQERPPSANRTVGRLS